VCYSERNLSGYTRTDGYSLGIRIEVIRGQKAVTIYLEKPDQGQGYRTYKLSRHVGTNIESWGSVEVCRLVKEGNAGSHIGGVGIIDIWRDVWARR
jgi:hypothetical protein